MALKATLPWTVFGLTQGRVTTRWRGEGAEPGQAAFLGLPRFDPDRCKDHCRECADACLSGAITLLPGENRERPSMDYGRCVVCQMCVEACPTGAFSLSSDWAFGSGTRDDLVWTRAAASPQGVTLQREIRRVFGRSLHIRHVDAGSCNGCESELQALNNPYYNLHRLGVFFTASPRFADLLLVTGPVTYAMRGPLLAAFEAMPEPRFVMAAGTCAVSGGTNGGGCACGNGLEGVLPVDMYLPGCPPNPPAIIHALLMLLQRAPQRVRGGQLDLPDPPGGEPHA